MPALLRNILAVIVGLVVCMAANGFLIALSSSVIPLPEGINPNDAKSIADNIDRYEVKHFIFPFLAHGLGSLIGAYIAALIAATHKMIFAVVIGVVHMIGGITMAFLILAPTWFIILDLGAAYLPAAWIGGKLAFRRA